MLGKDKKLIKSSLIVAFFLLVAYVLRWHVKPGDNVLLGTFAIMLRSMIHLMLFAVWFKTLMHRVVKPNIRKLLGSVAIMMLFWLFVKTVKFEFCISNTETIVRYLWYAFYIPMIFIPLQGLFIMNYIGKPDSYRTPKIMQGLYIVASILVFGVFTNDIHNLVFAFPEGIDKFDSVYTYGPLYYIIMTWFCLFGLIFVVTLLKKSRIPVSKKVQLLPLAVMIGAIIFWTLYCLRIIKCDLTVVDCIIIALLLESSIQIGLIPSNEYYSEVFRKTTVPLIIVDDLYIPHYTSDGAKFVTDTIMRETEKGDVDRGNFILRSSSINAGRVVWEDDVTHLNELKEELQEVNERLDGENVLLKAEVELKEQRASVEEKHRLYDRIASEVSSQLTKIALLIELARNDSKKARTALSKINIIGSYIKRRGNLRLLGEDNAYILSKELEYSMRESLDNLKLYDIYTSLNSQCDGSVNLDNTICIYDFYEEVVEKLLDTMSAMLVHLTCSDDTIKMRMQIGCTEEISEDVLNEITLERGRFSCSIQDEDIIIDVVVPNGGDAV